MKHVFNTSIADMEKEFRRYRHETIEGYEAEVARYKARAGVQLDHGARVEEAARHSFADNGVNLDKLDEMDAIEEQELEEFLQRIRPELIGQEVPFQDRSREDAVEGTFYGSVGGSQAQLIATDVLAPEREMLEGLEGEGGNPGVCLYNPKQRVERIAKRTGSGSGLGAYGSVPPIPTVWYFAWVPPTTGNYWVYVGVYYHGFYILRADDKWYNNKDTAVHAYTDIELHQYFPRGKKEIRIIEKADDNINEWGFLEGPKRWSFHEYLGGGDLVKIRVQFWLDVDARGSGSYAELNFKDGKANYIAPPVVLFVL